MNNFKKPSYNCFNRLEFCPSVLNTLSANLSLKIPRNLTFFPQPVRSHFKSWIVLSTGQMITIQWINNCAIHWIKFYLVPVVQKVDSGIRWINLYLVDNAIGFPNTYPPGSDLSDE